MIQFIQSAASRSTILRTLYYLKVDSPFAFRYNYFYPFLTVFALSALIYFVPITVKVWGENGVIPKLTPFLSVLTPFYIAALAAVSTFSGNKNIDTTFPPDHHGKVVTLTSAGDTGVSLPREITQRHFLSLLFGYCCIISMLLLLVSVFSSSVADGIKISQSNFINAASWTGFAIYGFLLFQILTLTLVSIYYLSDKIHRMPVPSGDQLISDIKNGSMDSEGGA